MTLVILSVSLLLLGGLLSIITSRRAVLSSWCGAGSVVMSGLLAAIPAFKGILTGTTVAFTLPWSIPGAALSLAVDPLSAFFLVPISIVSVACAVYGFEYMRNSGNGSRVGLSWLFFNVLVASMILVVVARDGAVFLLSWELMSLASFVLVLYDHHEPLFGKRDGFTL